MYARIFGEYIYFVAKTIYTMYHDLCSYSVHLLADNALQYKVYKCVKYKVYKCVFDIDQFQVRNAEKGETTELFHSVEAKVTARQTWGTKTSRPK